jgi:hypothetical protein
MLAVPALCIDEGFQSKDLIGRYCLLIFTMFARGRLKGTDVESTYPERDLVVGHPRIGKT